MSEGGTLRLDLELHPEDSARLARAPETRSAAKAARSTPLTIIWHDTPDAVLAARGLSLAERRQGRETLWRLERMRPDGAGVWPPGTPAPLIAEADSVATLGHAMPALLMPVAGFEGQIRRIAGGPVEVTLLSGVLRAVASERPVCRVALAGPDDAVMTLARTLAQTLRLCATATTLAAQAYVTARPAHPPRRLGAPALPPSLSVGDAFAYAVAHLADVILHYAPLVSNGEPPEPVHQLRVAVRRLRSVAKLFARAIACPELDAASAALRALGRALGPARDWDVFTSGTASELAMAFEDEPSVARLAVIAGRRRDAAYEILVAFLDSAAFRLLGLTLAGLAATRPWERAEASAVAEHAATDESDADPAHLLKLDLPHFAAKTLAKRHKRLFAPGPDIAARPAAELHAIRLDCKRMRYASEIFATLFPGRQTRKYMRRLTVLQERLGHLNDGAVAAGLLEELGQSRGFAGGVVRGFVGAGAAGSRQKIDRAWRRLRHQDAFWT